MSNYRDKVVCFQGATASGKSELAECIATILGGEIISADSMQIYRGMDIGTAKVPASERAVAYHCIDILDPGEPYSAALFQHDARAAIEDIRLRGVCPSFAEVLAFTYVPLLTTWTLLRGMRRIPFG